MSLISADEALQMFVLVSFTTYPRVTHRTAVTHSGEEHGEDVDRSLQQVVAANGDGHRRDEHQVAETEQQGGEELETVRVGLRVVCAPPAIPA